VAAAECRKALATLEAPDLESRSQVYAGRRIERIEGGWQLLNYAKYREARTRKQVTDAERQQRFRAKRAPSSDPYQRPPRRGSEYGEIYIAQFGHGGQVKIGYSRNVASRLEEMQTSNPAPITLLARFPGDVKDEAALHDRFASLRLVGDGARGSEWFSPGEALLKYAAERGVTHVTDRHAPIALEAEAEGEAEAEQQAKTPAPEAGAEAGVARATAEDGAAPGKKLVLGDRDAKSLSHAVMDYLGSVDRQTQDRLLREQLEKAVAAMTFAYWVKKGNHVGAIFDEERERVARARCRERRADPILAVASEMLYVVQGSHRDDFVMGRDPQSRGRHDRFKLLFRNREQVEHFAGLCSGYLAGTPHPLAARYLGGPDAAAAD
jgi:hypothetical protein